MLNHLIRKSLIRKSTMQYYIVRSTLSTHNVLHEKRDLLQEAGSILNIVNMITSVAAGLTESPKIYAAAMLGILLRISITGMILEIPQK